MGGKKTGHRVRYCEWSAHYSMSAKPEAVQLMYDPVDKREQWLCGECVAGIEQYNASQQGNPQKPPADYAGSTPWDWDEWDSEHEATDDDAWQRWVAEQEGKHFEKQAGKGGNGIWQGKGTGKKGKKSTATTYTYGPFCPVHHHRVPFKFSGFEVYLSASRDFYTEAQAKPADISLYFDTAWIGKWDVVWGTERPPWMPKLAVQLYQIYWPDMGVMDIQRLLPLLKWTGEQIVAGKRIEIGCMGGHGRTGTFLACLMVVFGWDGKEAIKEVRRQYCDSAIETPAQEKLIAEEMPKWIIKPKT